MEDREAIILEISEETLSDTCEKTRTMLNTYRKSGIKIAIDDFGKGASSMINIQDVNVDFLKIDGDFIKKLDAQSATLTLIQAMIAMSHKLRVEVIAQEIETPE